MTPARKRRMFELLVSMGFKEIEVGFPAASQTDFDFVRMLIEEDLIPDDVVIQVLTQSPRAPDRAHLRGHPRRQAGHRPPVQLDLDAAAPRRVRPGPRGHRRHRRARRASWCMKYAEQVPTDRGLLRVLARVLHRHRAGLRRGGLRRGHRGLAADAGPQGRSSTCRRPSRWHAQRLRRPDRVDAPPPGPPRLVVLSLHPHNDRGTAVAAAELGCMAGRRPHRGLPVRQRRAHRQRVPGHPGPEPVQPGHRPAARPRDIDEIRRTVEYCNQTAGHERHPYGGDLVYTAFSGSHQDAINKGLEAMEAEAAEAGVPVDEHRWEVPYLPIDPKDVGPHLRGRHPGELAVRQGRRRLHHAHRAQAGAAAPAADRVLQVIQQRTDEEGGEVSPEEMWRDLHRRVPARPRTTRGAGSAWPACSRTRSSTARPPSASCCATGRRHEVPLDGIGNGPIAAFCHALAAVRRRRPGPRLRRARHVGGRGRQGGGLPGVRGRRAGSCGGWASTRRSCRVARPSSARSTGRFGRRSCVPRDRAGRSHRSRSTDRPE